MSDLSKAGRQPDTEIPDRETILRRWDTWQKRIAADKDVSWARHEFELLLHGYEEEIGKLRAELDEAQQIMKPFVEWLSFVESHWRSIHNQTIVSGDTRSAVDVGHLRAARAFLSKHQRAE